MQTIVDNSYYKIEVDTSKNRLYITVKDNMISLEESTVISDLESGISLLTTDFSGIAIFLFSTAYSPDLLEKYQTYHSIIVNSEKFSGPVFEKWGYSGHNF